MKTDTLNERQILSDDVQAECWKNLLIYPDGTTAWGGHSFKSAQAALTRLLLFNDPTQEDWVDSVSGKPYPKDRTTIIQMPFAA